MMSLSGFRKDENQVCLAVPAEHAAWPGVWQESNTGRLKSQLPTTGLALGAPGADLVVVAPRKGRWCVVRPHPFFSILTETCVTLRDQVIFCERGHLAAGRG